MRTRRQAGSALILAIVMILLIIAMTGVLLTTTQNDLSTTGATDRHTKAGLFALSGVHIALTELNTNLNLEVTGDARVGYVIHGGPDETVTVRLLDAPGGSEVTFAEPYKEVYILDATARSGLSHGQFVPSRSTQRNYVAVLKQILPVPSQADAALAILGDPSKGKVDVKGKSNANIVGDGRDQVDPIHGVPGLGIEGRALEKMKLKFTDSEFTGYDGAGAAVTGAQPLSDPTLDFAALDAAARAIDAYAQGLMTASGTQTITDLNNGTKASPASYTFGSGPDSVTVVDASKKNHDWKNVNVTGEGTLIIYSGDGHFDIHDSTLDWKGDVILISGDDKDKDRVKIDHSSTVSIDGGLYIVGVGDKAAKLDVKGDDGKNKRAAALTVKGPTLVIADRTAKSKAELKLDSHQSKVQFDGYVGVFGDKVKVKAKHEKEANLVVNGSMVLGVPDVDKKTKVDVKISENIDINYNSLLYQEALDRLGRFLKGAKIPPKYMVGSFYEPALR
jgi:hypothetical protein